jgi:Zn ribbon nucleic-acid-binding protein
LKFLRDSHGDKNDVRSRSWIIYGCPACSHEEYFTMVPNFDRERFRKCPKCGYIEDENSIEVLKEKYRQLEAQKLDLEKQMKELQTKIEINEMTEKQPEQKEIVCQKKN